MTLPGVLGATKPQNAKPQKPQHQHIHTLLSLGVVLCLVAANVRKFQLGGLPTIGPVFCITCGRVNGFRGENTCVCIRLLATYPQKAGFEWLRKIYFSPLLNLP